MTYTLFSHTHPSDNSFPPPSFCVTFRFQFPPTMPEVTTPAQKVDNVMEEFTSPLSAQAPPSEENPFGPPPGYGQQSTASMLPANLARHQAKIFLMPTEAIDGAFHTHPDPADNSDFESVASSRAGSPIPAHRSTIPAQSTISAQLTIPAQPTNPTQPTARARGIPGKGGLSNPLRTRFGRIKRGTSHTTGAAATQSATQVAATQRATAPPAPIPIDKVQAVLRNLHYLQERVEVIDTRTTATATIASRIGKNFDFYFATDKRTNDLNLLGAWGHQPMMPVREELGQIWSMLATLKGEMAQSLGLMQKSAGDNERILAKIEDRFASFVDFAVNRAKEAFTQEAIAKERTR